MKIGCPSDEVQFLIFANFTSLSEIPANIHSHMNAVMSWCLGENLNNAAVILMPAHTYNRGKLYLEEQRVTAALGGGWHEFGPLLLPLVY